MSDINYSKSGVNIDEGNRFVQLIKPITKSTHNSAVLGGIGGFAGLYSIAQFKNMQNPILVSATDGVGTKLRVAIDAGVFDTVGIDLVAMSVNDLVVTGARPLLFLDYIATGKLDADAMSEVLRGVAEGCKMSDSALIGGETAEMPGMYAMGDFDLAGFAVGIVDKQNIIDGSGIKAGDVIMGMSSSGFHSNGYSLLRKVFFDHLGMKVNDLVPGFGTVAELLLTPTKIYVRNVLAVLDAGVHVKGMVHVTGGGFYDNIPRILPAGTDAIIYTDSFPKVKAIEAFRSIADIDERELYRVFNMGVGYIFIVSADEVGKLNAALATTGESAYQIGKIVAGNNDVKITGIDL